MEIESRTLAFGEQRMSWLDRLIAYVRQNSILQELPSQPIVLDLGCGYDGRLLHSMQDRIIRGTGVDLSTDPAAQTDKITLIKGRIDEPLPFPNSSFDLVTALAVIEHVERPEVMLAEICRLLKPGGKLLLTTPSKYGKWPLELLARFSLISKQEIEDHKRYYDRDSLTKALKKAGFLQQNIQVRHFGILYLNLFAKAVKN